MCAPTVPIRTVFVGPRRPIWGPLAKQKEIDELFVVAGPMYDYTHTAQKHAT